MDLYAVIDQVVTLLRQRGRLTYRALQYQFSMDEAGLEALKEELIEGQQVATDEGGKVLVWKGGGSVTAQSSSALAPVPASYTPPHLAARIRIEQAALEARSGTDGERKTITALFADLKGSTALIEGLDPEEARAIIDPALQLMMDAVHRYEGYVAQALGDGIFALFGAPIAHEDHPQRALYAALRMQEEMRSYAGTLRTKGYPPLLMRVGINTGEVVVRSIHKDDLHTDYVPVGHSTNLAARMEQLAAPGSVLVTEQTHKLTNGYFAFKTLGKTHIKGVEEPLQVYEALGAGPLRTRLQVIAAGRGLTQFVGRQSEMEQIQRALVQAKVGHGQIVGVMGEPGLGKSRLFYEFKLLSHSGCLLLEAYSVSHGKASPYLPVIELLKSYCDIQGSDDERKRREKVTGKVLTLDRSLEDTLPYLFALLGIEEQPSPLQQMDSQIRRRRTFEALKRLFLRESLNQPLLLIFEDLHWVDSETQGFLDILSEGVASAQILLLVNYRPEYRHEWGQKTYYTQLRLAPLGKDEAEELLAFLLGSDVGLKSLKQLILDKSEGTPFFIEEIVQELIEQRVLVRDAAGAGLGPARIEGTHKAGPLHIPSTVQGVLAARIDRLVPDEKALLQQLAVIGREFPLSLICHVIRQAEDDLYRLLSSLQHKEFLYEQPAFPEVEYTFKHALTQEVAYNSVLIERRKVLHEQTAQTIESLYHGKLEEHYDELAHHYSRSGNIEKSIEYLHKAGQQAVQRSANVEAIRHLTSALELLKTLSDTPERAQRELALQIALGGPLLATEGLASVHAEQTYLRARDLCQYLGDTQQLFSVLLGLGTCYQQQGKLHAARELGEQGLTLAQSLQDPTLLLKAHSALGMYLHFLGEPLRAHAHFEQGIALYTPQLHDLLTFHYWCDFGVLCRGFAAKALRLLGYPDQALQRSREALALAHELSHPQSLAFAFYVAGMLHHFRREEHVTKEWAEAELALASEQGFPLWSAWGMMLRGSALALQGQSEAGIAQLCHGLGAFRTMGSGLLVPHCLGLLAEAYGTIGDTKEGLTAVAEALAIAVNTGQQHYEAELYRLQGELTLVQSRVQGLVSSVQKEAEDCFLKAIETARKQQAKSLELRAATSLARLWRQQGKRAEAHKLLSEIYNWFTEGFDTKDLKEAQVLLEELA